VTTQSLAVAPTPALSPLAAAVGLPKVLRTPDLREPDTALLRQNLRDYFINTFDTYESLFGCLSTQAAYYEKPIPLRHPLIFYLGHTATFFINKLVLARVIDSRINPAFESLFAVGVDEMSWDDLGVALDAWPAVSEVQAYRCAVRQRVLSLIDQLPLAGPIDWNSPWWAIIMGIEHERIHLETSSVLIRQHRLDYTQSQSAWPVCPEAGAAPQNCLLPVPAGTVTLGKSQSDPYYGWDNEYGQHQAAVAEFQAAKYLVSNGEFMAFVEAGGYQTPGFWTEEGQRWLAYTQAQWPSFWLRRNERWWLRTMTEEIPMPWNWPVEVNCLEAEAFCAWKAQVSGQPVRLPTEDEWYRLYDHAGCQALSDDTAPANLHLDHYASACPVDKFPQGDWYDVIGNVWQWTQTPIYPFSGFDVHPWYDDFTTPTFDERHNLIKGGSFISCGNEATRSARYAFRRHFFQHAGFRYIIAAKAQPVPSSHYETDKLLAEYAEFHYGDSYFGVPNFPKALVDFARPYYQQRPMERALDLGCASGRAAFELARDFAAVNGIDFSARFIQQAVHLIDEGQLRYTLTDEGELVSYKSRSLEDLGLSQVTHKLAFYQGDACNLRSQFTHYDFILAANLIDRLYKPRAFLERIHERLRIGGLLLITSPYTWLEEHTPKEEWIGGYKKDGERFTTLDGLEALLAAHFRRITGPESVPFVIRETQRKYQHSLSEVTLWERIR
jgi:5-histidylcysteine sulfoxide synthase/putative 4-mercaptohistidine N1-methyltranferase